MININDVICVKGYIKSDFLKLKYSSHNDPLFWRGWMRSINYLNCYSFDWCDLYEERCLNDNFLKFKYSPHNVPLLRRGVGVRSNHRSLFLTLHLALIFFFLLLNGGDCVGKYQPVCCCMLSSSHGVIYNNHFNFIFPQ